MSIRVAINGFGRIGRNVLRAIVEGGRKDIEWSPSTISRRSRPMRICCASTRVHGRFPGEVTVKGDSIDCGTGPIKVTAIKDPTQLAVEGARHRRRARMHRHFHIEGQGFGAP